MNNSFHLPPHSHFLCNWGFCFLLLLTVTLASCSSSKSLSKTEYRELAAAGQRLGFDIDRKDNHRLMVEASNWLGTPYRNGGTTRKGVDCSGFTGCLYERVYHIKLSRSSQLQLNNDVRKRVRKKDLKQGDLVFFSYKKSRKRIGHVGVYLKEGKFIHASSSKGVRIDRLDDDYWNRYWVTGGRVIMD